MGLASNIRYIYSKRQSSS